MNKTNITRVTEYSVHFDSRMYPLPQQQLHWRLLYAPDLITIRDMLHAASIISAYKSLVMEPERIRRKSVRAIRTGIAMQPEYYTSLLGGITHE